MLWLSILLLLAWAALGPWVVVGVAALLLVPRVRWWALDRVHVTWRNAGIGALALGLVGGLVAVLPDGLLPVPQSPGVLAVPSYTGRPASPRPLPASPVPDHPHLARTGVAVAGSDAWSTGAVPWRGPLGAQPEVRSAWYGLEDCATLTVDAADRLVALCSGREGPALHVIDPDSLRKLASKALPALPESDLPGWRQTCGTAMYLDAADRAVLATTDRRVLAFTTADGEGDAQLSTDQSWDLTPYVPEGDCLVALLPDESGRIWWASRAGLVGTIAAHSEEVRVHDLEGTVTNPISTDGDGVYVLTDTALHRLASGPDGMPRVVWRREYDRGTERRPARFAQGGGTAPTLLDDGLVAFADNAEPRTQVVFVRRSDGEQVCRAAVFGEGSSSVEASLVSVGSGVVVANSSYRGPVSTVLGRAGASGIARVDVKDGKCRKVWENDQSAPSAAPKVSWETGLVYAYTKRATWSGVSAWYLTATDATTGRHRWSVRTGTGLGMNAHHSSPVLTPDGSVYVGTLAGLVRVRDRR